ncbi:MAG: hypothetical protein ACREPJ_15970, partial [Rhodanobacteraceae bacterium]
MPQGSGHAASAPSVAEASATGHTSNYRYFRPRDAVLSVRALNCLSATGSIGEYLRYIFNLPVAIHWDHSRRISIRTGPEPSSVSSQRTSACDKFARRSPFSADAGSDHRYAPLRQ